jgi:hypothetical protein
MGNNGEERMDNGGEERMDNGGEAPIFGRRGQMLAAIKEQILVTSCVSFALRRTRRQPSSPAQRRQLLIQLDNDKCGNRPHANEQSQIHLPCRLLTSRSACLPACLQLTILA